MNVLIDTNVLLSAALRDKLLERVVLYAAGRDHFRWLVTPEILAEYTDVLRRPKFGLDQQTLERRGELLAMRTVNVGSPPEAPNFPRELLPCPSFPNSCLGAPVFETLFRAFGAASA